MSREPRVTITGPDGIPIGTYPLSVIEKHTTLPIDTDTDENTLQPFYEDPRGIAYILTHLDEPLDIEAFQRLPDETIDIILQTELDHFQPQSRRYGNEVCWHASIDKEECLTIVARHRKLHQIALIMKEGVAACFQHGMIEAAFILSQHGAPVDWDEALATSVRVGNYYGARISLDHGATPEVGLVAEAAKSKQLEIVKLLHRCGADIRWDNDAAITEAARAGSLEIVQWLHEHGANVAAYYNRPVNQAAMAGHWHVVRYLRQHGAFLKRKCRA